MKLSCRYGKKLLLMCREYQNLARNTREMAMIIESLWIKTEVQLCSLKALWDTLPTALQAHYSSALQYLENKMVVAMESIQKIETLTAMDATSRQKIKALLVGRLLKQTVHDLEDWQRRFDPSWYLITRIASPTVDKRLADRVCDNCPPARRLAQMRRAIEDVG